MAPQFPPDILSVIFEHFKDEYAALFNFLQVNKFWCEAVVPILWRNPLKNQYENGKNQIPIMVKGSHSLMFCVRKESICLLRTLLTCLPNESKNLLSQNGYELSNEILRQPIFDYANYCRCICTSDVSMLIWSGINKRYISHPSFNFRCSSYISPTIFYGLAQICRNIEDLTVEFCDRDHDGVNSLIRVQKEMKYFECKLINGGEEQCCQLLGNALKSQAHSLLKLDLGKQSCIPLIVIPDFTYLCYLRFGLSSEISEETAEYLKKAKLPNLVTLIIDGDPVRSDILESLIIGTNGNFQKLHMSGWCPDGIDDPGYILPVLSGYCPKLKILTIWIDEDDYEELEVLLNICQELECIYLRCANMYTDEPELFNILKRVEMPNLSKLKLEDCWLVDQAYAFEEFLRCRKNREDVKPISLEVVGYINSEMYLDVLSLYRWYGVLKETKVLVYGEDSAPDDILPPWKVAAKF
ncbi:112_t:CDS:2 [Diversispora eburnea]|uniref:112_t:CDS:1 n=1 Tax=Diversispora eburnea TaxID=1213867 RepID=A0A9N8VTK9_9GLOM|nr:112_t:CDS:2 [Diversispora eburnea]